MDVFFTDGQNLSRQEKEAKPSQIFGNSVALAIKHVIFEVVHFYLSVFLELFRFLILSHALKNGMASISWANIFLCQCTSFLASQLLFQARMVLLVEAEYIRYRYNLLTRMSTIV